MSCVSYLPSVKREVIESLAARISFHGYFKPSIAEVMAHIAQLPVEIQEKVVAFELVRVPQTAGDLREHQEATEAGFHVATARHGSTRGGVNPMRSSAGVSSASVRIIRIEPGPVGMAW
jgi:hypothetical protein